MRAHSVALALAFLATSALAVDIVEMKNGRLYEAERVTFRGDRLSIKLHFPKQDKRVIFTVPIHKVVPEFVYYAWADQIEDGDTEARVKLAEWSRANGLFRHAWKQYRQAAANNKEILDGLEELSATMHEEEATWIYHRAEQLFRDDEVKVSRARAELILKKFADTKEAGRAKALLSILAEREQFLTEQKKQEEIAKRARKQKKQIDKHVDRIRRADRLVLGARLSNPLDARRRLRWSGFAYRAALLTFQDLLLFVEVDELRFTLKALSDEVNGRIARTFLRLADIDYLMGHVAGALDAVHEVLAVDPTHEAATRLREKILDDGPGTVRIRGGVTDTRYSHIYWRRFGHASLATISRRRGYRVWGYPRLYHWR